MFGNGLHIRPGARDLQRHHANNVVGQLVWVVAARMGRGLDGMGEANLHDTRAPGQSARGITRKQIAAICVGNGLDFYDFLTFAYFAPQIGRYAAICTPRRRVGNSGGTEAPGIRHAFAAPNQSIDHLQGNGQPARGADPTRAHQDRKHRAVCGRRRSRCANPSAEVYRGMTPLSDVDIARTIYCVATQPPNININTLELMPTEQSFAGFAVDTRS